MQVRTQLAVIALIAAGWSAGNRAFVRPVMPERQGFDRMSLASLESVVARNSDNVRATRMLTQRYLDLAMPRLVMDTVARANAPVQRDGRVSLHAGRAQALLGEVNAASARINGALNRCVATPPELVEGAGCDVRTQTELAIESAALDRMIEWHITPLSDPARAALAHEMATRPLRMVTVRP